MTINRREWTVIVLSAMLAAVVMASVICGCTAPVGAPNVTVQVQPGAIVVNMQVGSTSQPALNIPVNVSINGKLLSPATKPAKE